MTEASDQRHILIKLLGFEVDPAIGGWQELSSINITLGLPIIRINVSQAPPSIRPARASPMNAVWSRRSNKPNVLRPTRLAPQVPAGLLARNHCAQIWAHDSSAQLTRPCALMNR